MEFDFRIKILTVLKNRFLIILTVSLNACFTNKKILFIDIIRFQNRIKMNIMEPILTFKTLKHVEFLFINSFLIMGLFAVAVNIIEIITVFIKTVIIIFFIHQLATLGQSTVSTVASEIQFTVQFIHFVVLVALQHASQTETMCLNSILFFYFNVWNFFQKLFLLFFFHFLELNCNFF